MNNFSGVSNVISNAYFFTLSSDLESKCLNIKIYVIHVYRFGFGEFYGLSTHLLSYSADDILKSVNYAENNNCIKIHIGINVNLTSVTRQCYLTVS